MLTVIATTCVAVVYGSMVVVYRSQHHSYKDTQPAGPSLASQGPGRPDTAYLGRRASLRIKAEGAWWSYCARSPKPGQKHFLSAGRGCEVAG